MIHMDLKTYPLIVIFFTEHNWTEQSYATFITHFKKVITKAKPCSVKLFIRGNAQHTHFTRNIPMWYYSTIIRDICKLKPMFREKLIKTVIYTPSDAMKFFFDMLFKVYTPARPLKLFNKYDHARQWITDNTTGQP